MILVAAIVAIILGLITKFGAVIRSIPNGVFGGTTLVLYSLIAITGVRIWVVNRINFTGSTPVIFFCCNDDVRLFLSYHIDPRNIYVGGVPLMLAAVMTTTSLQINDFQLDGIGCATFSSIILYQVLRGYDGFKEYYQWTKEQVKKTRRS